MAVSDKKSGKLDLSLHQFFLTLEKKFSRCPPGNFVVNMRTHIYQYGKTVNVNLSLIVCNYKSVKV